MNGFPDSELAENEALHSLLTLTGMQILEIGCGDGRMMRHYAAETRRAFGLDNDFAELSAGRANQLNEQGAVVQLAQGRAESLPYADAAFDVVLLGWSLCCVEAAGQPQALREAFRVARSVILDIRAVLDPPEMWLRDSHGRELRCGPLQRAPGDTHSNEGASLAVAGALEAGWLRLADYRDFVWLDVYETVDEMLSEITEEWQSWVVDEEVVLRLMRLAAEVGRGAIPYVRQGVRAQVLTRVRG